MTTETVHLQREYMGTRMTYVIVHGVPVDVNGNSLVGFSTRHGQVGDVAISIAVIAIGEFVRLVTLISKGFAEIPNVRAKPDVPSDGGTLFFLLGVCYLGIHVKIFPGKNAAPEPSQSEAAEIVEEYSKANDRFWGRW